MYKKYFILKDKHVRNNCKIEIDYCPDNYIVEIRKDTRSKLQNAKMWSLLNEVSKKIKWHGRYLDVDSWKNIFSSNIKKQECVPNLDGTGFVVLGQSTSSFTKDEMGELIELIEYFIEQNSPK